MEKDCLPREDHAKIHTEAIARVQKIERRVKELEDLVKKLQEAKKGG